jgi:hypothetical protein
MLLDPVGAAVAAWIVTCKEVGDRTVTELAVTPVPDTNTDGVPLKPLPVRTTVLVPPAPTAPGATFVMGGPGVVTS